MKQQHYSVEALVSNPNDKEEKVSQTVMGHNKIRAREVFKDFLSYNYYTNYSQDSWEVVEWLDIDPLKS